MDVEIKKVLFRVLPFLLIFLGIAIAVKRKKLSKAELFLHRPNSYRRLFVCWILFVTFILLTEITLSRFGLLDINPWSNSLVPSIIKLIGMIVLAPIAEELVFRGVALAKLKHRKVSKHVAIIIQALIFVVVHSGAFENTLQTNIAVLQRFTDAVIYGYAMYYTRSIYTPIALHATGNAVAALEQFVL